MTAGHFRAASERAARTPQASRFDCAPEPVRPMPAVWGDDWRNVVRLGNG
jgi:hypothetical protein